MDITVPLDVLVDCGLGRGGVAQVVSRLLAFSTARLSYSSQSFAVFPGVHGGGRGSLNGEAVLASGEDWCGAKVVVEDIVSFLHRKTA